MRRVSGDLAGVVGSIGELTIDAATGRLRVDAGSGGGSIPNPLPIQADSAGDAFAVTPSDSTIINAVALYVGTGGNVVIETRNGNPVTFANVPDGSILPVFAVKVMATTTATGIVGLTY